MKMVLNKSSFGSLFGETFRGVFITQNVHFTLGAFGECHDFVDPEPYHEACVYDLCAYLPNKDVFCDSVEEYAEACLKKGVDIEHWRSGARECRK